MNRSNAHRLLVPSLLAAAVLLLAPSTALAAFNVYLELTLNGTTIEGESSV